jgi:hypothetical protein
LFNNDFGKSHVLIFSQKLKKNRKNRGFTVFFHLKPARCGFFQNAVFEKPYIRFSLGLSFLYYAAHSLGKTELESQEKKFLNLSTG